MKGIMHNVTYIYLQIHATSILTFFPSLDPSCLLSVCWSHVVLFWFWDGGRQLGFIDRLMYMRRHAPINVRYRKFAILTKCCVWCGNFSGDYCNYKMAGKVKKKGQNWLLGRQPALGECSRGTWRALVGHLVHVKVPHISLSFHFMGSWALPIHISDTR